MQQQRPNNNAWLGRPAARRTAGADVPLSLYPGLEEGSTQGCHNIAAEVAKLVSENAAVVIGRRGCCMCHVVNTLLQGLGANPTIVAVDEKDEAAIVDELPRLLVGVNDSKLQFPAIFVGGKSMGGLEKLMSIHIAGELVPKLREARALWL